MVRSKMKEGNEVNGLYDTPKTQETLMFPYRCESVDPSHPLDASSALWGLRDACRIA